MKTRVPRFPLETTVFQAFLQRGSSTPPFVWESSSKLPVLVPGWEFWSGRLWPGNIAFSYFSLPRDCILNRSFSFVALFCAFSLSPRHYSDPPLRSLTFLRWIILLASLWNGRSRSNSTVNIVLRSQTILPRNRCNKPPCCLSQSVGWTFCFHGGSTRPCFCSLYQHGGFENRDFSFRDWVMFCCA